MGSAGKMIVVVKSGEMPRVCSLWLVAACSVSVACSASSGEGTPFSSQTPTPTATATAPPTPPTLIFRDAGAGPTFNPFGSGDLGALCAPSRSIRSDGPALLVRDPEVLARFALERTLSQIIATSVSRNVKPPAMSPLELIQRLFDTDNTKAQAVFADAPHCDDAPASDFGLGKPADCPRAEGRLASTAGLFAPEDPDGFIPVAIVNRFDLMPDNLTSCGEFRIVYAKRSGLTDPNDRAFLIFEGALANTDLKISACRGIAELWASLETSSTPEERADRLEELFFAGYSKHVPVVSAGNFGLGKDNCTYAGVCGQVRVAEGMQTPLRFREFRLTGVPEAVPPRPMYFAPRAVTNSPLPELFDSTVPGYMGTNFRGEFPGLLAGLVSADLARLSLRTGYDATESALDGPARPDYVSRVQNSGALGDDFIQAISNGLDTMPSQPSCPSDDPMTPVGLLERATVLTCAGCHAPERLISADRAIGCGQVWPKSLGATHIDEHGNLSPALVDLFLPHRADVLATYLRACDPVAISNNLQPSPSLARPECFVAGTEVTMADGSQKPIERVEVGDMVLSFDEGSSATVSAPVERTFVRPETDHLIVVDGSLVATPNHLFRTGRGWLPAELLRPNDVLVRLRRDPAAAAAPLEAEAARVSALEMRPGSVTTYNLAVAGHHDFFAGGVLVHDGP